MRKSDRLFQLTNLLRAHQPLTARELATRLCVSERTIYRYMDDLSWRVSRFTVKPGWVIG